MKRGNIINRAKLATNFSFNLSSENLFPQKASIELTNHCNLKCVMCPHPIMTRDKGIMDFNLFCRIIDQLKGKTEFVYLYGIGESLLIKNFFDYADYAVKSELSTCLSTNITVMNETIAEKLIQSGIDFIVLPIDGADKETYDSNRVGSEFYKAIQKCKMVIQSKIQKKSKTDITIQYIVMKEDEAKAEKLKSFFSKEEIQAVNQFRIKPHLDTFVHPKEGISHTIPCYLLWNYITIGWEGKVHLCCMDYDMKEPLGDISKESIAEIWNSKKLRQFRDWHKTLQYEKMPLCNQCTLPEKNYFSHATILGSIFVNSWMLRKIMPVYEKFLFKFKKPHLSQYQSKDRIANVKWVG